MYSLGGVSAYMVGGVIGYRVGVGEWHQWLQGG